MNHKPSEIWRDKIKYIHGHCFCGVSKIAVSLYETEQEVFVERWPIFWTTNHTNHTGKCFEMQVFSSLWIIIIIKSFNLYLWAWPLSACYALVLNFKATTSIKIQHMFLLRGFISKVTLIHVIFQEENLQICIKWYQSSPKRCIELHSLHNCVSVSFPCLISYKLKLLHVF